jgi:hypothetical protein
MSWSKLKREEIFSSDISVTTHQIARRQDMEESDLRFITCYFCQLLVFEEDHLFLQGQNIYTVEEAIAPRRLNCVSEFLLIYSYS